VVEAALLAFVAGRLPEPTRRIEERLTALGAALRSHIYTSRNVAGLRRRPYTAVALGVSHLALGRTGHADPGVDRLLREVVASGDLEAYERLPYRAMEVAWLMEHLTGAHERVLAVAGASVVSFGVRPFHATVNDVYALTHAAMYLTDFGARPWPRRIDPGTARRAVDACLRWQLLTGNLDLLGELVMTEVMLGELSLAGHVAWALLADARAELGFLPSPSFSTGEYGGLTGAEARAYAVRHVYHTEFVWAILCAVAAGRECLLAYAPSQREPTVAAAPNEWRTEATAAKLERLEATCARHDVGGRDLLSLALDGLLVEAVRAYDLARVGRLLGDALRLNLSVTQTILDATRFVERQSLG
jgi:hypothetical protein